MDAIKLYEELRAKEKAQQRAEILVNNIKFIEV